MQQKTERFELRLDPAQLDRVDEWRRKQDDFPSRAEAIRNLIDVGLETRSQPQITDGEKLLLIMLGELAKGLKVKTDIDPDFIAEVIYGGHYWALDWRYVGIFHGHNDKRSTVSEVVNILDMWSYLENSFAQLPKKEQERVKKDIYPWTVSYPGFDGNHESDHMGIAGFFVEKMDRFQTFKERGFLNSHMPTLDRHRRMLKGFEPLRKDRMGSPFTGDEIIAIMKFGNVA